MQRSQEVDYSLSRSERLRKRKDYTSLQRRGRRVHSKWFVAAFRQSKSSNQMLLGVTVSKKISKRAVQRNRIKRQVKEFFRTNKIPLQLVVIAKQGGEAVENSDLREDLIKLRAGLGREVARLARSSKSFR